MVTRARSIPELPNLAVPASDDLLVVVDVSASNTTKKATLATVVGSNDITLANNATLSANTFIVRNELSPSFGTQLVVKKGTLFFDTNYLYIAVSDNLVKRVALENF